ncbi:hypothetical protein T4B_3633 [Trichinella pseudospiralis]|uniref:Uncharacterized protein n=1 Tax=Trichinella pseudospiralis TaxID=6337 RepID=A0A0V1GS22_TRIPS|nr:hypothetical protein T4B_3633 [Trichinella pseudospiralis]
MLLFHSLTENSEICRIDFSYGKKQLTSSKHIDEDSFNEMIPADVFAEMYEGDSLVAEKQAKAIWDETIIIVCFDSFQLNGG